MKINRILKIVFCGFTFQIIPRGVLTVGPHIGKIQTKHVPFFKWCIWKPIFRWDECGKSVTWLLFHVGYIPWWLRKPINVNYKYEKPTDKEKINKLEHKIAELELQVEELECKLQGLIKCVECDGAGGRYTGSTGRLGHPQDPQTWEYCKACDGEGWVKA